MLKRNLFYVALILFGTLMTLTNATRSSDPYRLFDPLVDVCDIIRKNYVTEIDETTLVDGAINGMLHQLDDYSEYIPANDVEDFKKQTSGSYEGLGIVIDVKDGVLTVVSPFEDSPADQAGIMAGDIILEVDGESTKHWSTTRAVKELTGQAGSSVTLLILHKDGTEEELEVTRREIHVPTIRGFRRSANGKREGSAGLMLDEETKIGYVRITQFSMDTAKELDRAVESLREDGMQALILDLRSNPGGLMSAAVEVVDRFIEEGVIVSTRGAHTTPESQRASSANTYPRFHLVILIDRGSASASEIVAGALQDHGRAVIVGKRSWGKGSVQRTIRLPDSGDIVKLTTDYYYLPKGRCVHKRPDAETWGVEPDIEVELDSKNYIKLRKHMNALMDPEPDPCAPPENQGTLAEQIDTLLELDAQLDQAVKLCKGLVLAQPGLKSLASEALLTNRQQDQLELQPEEPAPAVPVK